MTGPVFFTFIYIYWSDGGACAKTCWHFFTVYVKTHNTGGEDCLILRENTTVKILMFVFLQLCHFIFPTLLCNMVCTKLLHKFTNCIICEILCHSSVTVRQAAYFWIKRWGIFVKWVQWNFAVYNMERLNWSRYLQNVSLLNTLVFRYKWKILLLITGKYRVHLNKILCRTEWVYHVLWRMKHTCVGNTGKAKVSNDFGVTEYCPTVQCTAAPALACL
jgi:hypothetical protein